MFLGSVGSFSLDVTVFVAVEITLIPPSDGRPVCGPVSATQTWLPSGVTARFSGSKPTWMSVCGGNS
jgi:hypothetical protein